MNRRLPPRKSLGHFYAFEIDGIPGNNEGPYAPPPVDDVTGMIIAPGHIGMQDGLLKDTRPIAGSWENSLRHRPLFPIVLDGDGIAPVIAFGQEEYHNP